MRRLNFLQDDPWDEENDETNRVRWFGHPFGTDQLGASLIEYLPRAPDSPMHMHYGVEEMFFVLSGTPTVRTPEGAEQLSPGDVVYFPEGPDGLHTFSNPHGRTGEDDRDLDQAVPGCRRLSGARSCLGGDTPSRTPGTRGRRPRSHRSLRAGTGRVEPQRDFVR